uniref:G-protein coupled receptors family 1 profile domain-containing protein n=1 Tax=Neogobius melanostomus TaxID=47308 RepID=A0A8C6SJY2_9GOBI
MVILVTIILEKSLHQPMYIFICCLSFMILGVMAYDRFVAICQPLHYHTKMTVRKVFFLWTAAVVYPLLSIGCCVSLAVELPLCGNKLPAVLCTGWRVVANSCIDTTLNDIVGRFVTVTTVIIALLFVLYSYMRILIVCKRGSAEVRGKALQTCVPHLVTFVTYSCSVFFDLTLVRLDTNKINPIASTGKNINRRLWSQPY